MTCRLRHLSPEALAPDGLCCSAHHRSIGLIRQSGELRVLSRTPVMDAVLDIQGSQHPVCPPHRSFTTELSRIAATCTPGDPVRASQFFRTGTGDRVERRPLASPNTPASRIPCGERFFDASYGRSLSLRPSRLFASLSDRTRGTSSSLPTEAFTSPLPDAGSPRHPWGYDYDAKLRIAPAGLPPASSAASLAALAPNAPGIVQARCRTGVWIDIADIPSHSSLTLTRTEPGLPGSLAVHLQLCNIPATPDGPSRLALAAFPVLPPLSQPQRRHH